MQNTDKFNMDNLLTEEEIENLSNQSLNILIAQFIGWKDIFTINGGANHGKLFGTCPDNNYLHFVPDYCSEFSDYAKLQLFIMSQDCYRRSTQDIFNGKVCYYYSVALSDNHYKQLVGKAPIGENMRAHAIAAAKVLKAVKESKR